MGLEPTCGVFLTTNLTDLGSSIPEGLRSLFRPVAVLVPDQILICENILLAEGFHSAKSLACKFCGLYTLLRELLSKQKHYDW